MKGVHTRNPTLIGARNNLGLALTRAGRVGEAIACLRELLAAGVKRGQSPLQLLLALLQALCCFRRLGLFVAQRPPPGFQLRRLPGKLALLLAN